jgi:hypothetical protein
MQSDQFHYIHHAKFECNYGSASFPLDHWFGTFRDRMVGMGTYKGAGQEDEVKEKTKPSPFKMNTPPGFNVYLLFTAVIFAVAVSALVGQPTTEMPRSVAALLAFGPIGFGVVLRQVLGDTQPLSWYVDQYITSLCSSVRVCLCAPLSLFLGFTSVTTIHTLSVSVFDPPSSHISLSLAHIIAIITHSQTGRSTKRSFLAVCINPLRSICS